MFNKILKLFGRQESVDHSPSKVDGVSMQDETYVKDVFQLIDIICLVYDSGEYKPRGGNTFCNFAAYDIARMYGEKDFPRKLANAQADYLYSSHDWVEVKLSDAQKMVNSGTLIFAVQKSIPNGHICVIRPGKQKTSGKWTDVPSCMNIGKENFISKGLNWAFQDLPKLYAWKPSL